MLKLKRIYFKITAAFFVLSFIIIIARYFDGNQVDLDLPNDSAIHENIKLDHSIVVVLPCSDVIHVATFIQGPKYTFELMVFLKSILANNRRHPLKLHIIVANSSTKSVVLEMLVSWQIAGLDFNFYEIHSFNNWELSNYTLSNSISDRWKMLIPTILNDVEKVIVADVNLQIVGDIAMIWNKLLEMQRMGTFIGMVGKSPSRINSQSATNKVQIHFQYQEHSELE